MILVCAAAATLGCSEGLYHDLDEHAANEMVVALHESGIQAMKVEQRGTWTVEIPRGFAPSAMHALEQRGLPRPQIAGFSETYSKNALVPSPEQERAMFQHATAQEVRRGLVTIDGVVDAQVVLVLATPESRRRTQPEPPRGSVVVRWTGDEPPVSEHDVRRLVAAAVAGLTPEQVEVFLSRVPETAPPELDLVRVGPLTVPAPEKSLTQLVLAGLISSILVLGLMLIAFVRGGQRA